MPIKLEDSWYSRVKAMLFVNSAYPVTHNSILYTNVVELNFI